MDNSSTDIQHAAVNKIVSDYRIMTEEMNLQLKIIEDLNNEKMSIMQQLNQCQREVELCMNSDKLNARRNTALVKENKGQQQKINDLSLALKNTRSVFEKIAIEIKASFDGSTENLLCNNKKLGECIVKKDTQLNQLRKQIRRLTGKGDFLQGFLADAIIKTLNEKNRDCTVSNSDTSAHAALSGLSFDELAQLNIDNLKLEDFKCIFRHFLSRITEQKAARKMAAHTNLHAFPSKSIF